mgnify:CR=1 FL=1
MPLNQSEISVLEATLPKAGIESEDELIVDTSWTKGPLAVLRGDIGTCEDDPLGCARLLHLLDLFFNLLFLLLDQAYGAEVIGLAVQSNIDVFEDVVDLGDVLCNNIM